MKTIEQVLARGFNAFDGRDFNRFAAFLTAEQIEAAGGEFNSPKDRQAHGPIEYTREAVLKQLEHDVAFGFEKALNQRGLSAGLMYEVVRMWNWVLEEGLENFDNYAMYGLPLFKAVALKYGWPNPIGEDLGSEDKYN